MEKAQLRGEILNRWRDNMKINRINKNSQYQHNKKHKIKHQITIE